MVACCVAGCRLLIGNKWKPLENISNRISGSSREGAAGGEEELIDNTI